jgi:Protein of unknown function (DUF3182)
MTTNRIVLVYYSRLGGRLWPHQKILLDEDAKAIAKLKRCEFGGHHKTGDNYPGSVFFVPDDTLLVDEASGLGIHSPNEFYGGVVPYPFVKTKAITHGLIEPDAQRPQGWSAGFPDRVRQIVLQGYTVFSPRDARIAAERMLKRGSIRVKRPLGASGRGQTLIESTNELEAALEKIAAEELATYGLVLEENLQEIRTLSVGCIAVDGLEISYHGTQRTVRDNEGRSVYGGSDLLCVRGGWNELNALPMTTEAQAAVTAARRYDEAVVEYSGFMASRRNYDVGRGLDTDGRLRLGVLESSWRIGGASSAELVALAAFAKDPSLPIVRASHIQVFGKKHEAPADAIIHFQGDDPEAGPLLRYTVVQPTMERLQG